MSSTDRNQNAEPNTQFDNTQAANAQPNQGLLASVGETLSHAKDQLVGALTKNEEAAKEQYHQKQAENADTLVDQAKHKGQEWQHAINKNVESTKENYHDQARQDNQERVKENIENAEPKGYIQSAVDTLSNMKDQVVSSFNKTMEPGKESYSNERVNDSSNLANRESEWERKDRPNMDSRRENLAENQRSMPEDSQNKGLIQSAMDSLSHMKDEFVSSFNKNTESAKEEYYKQKSDNDNNLVDQTKDKAKEWGHGIQKNVESTKEDFHSQAQGGDENKGILQSAADKLSHMKDQAASSLNKNAKAAKEEYYSNKADNSSNLVDQAKNKGKEWQHNVNKNVEAAKEEFHADA